MVTTLQPTRITKTMYGAVHAPDVAAEAPPAAALCFTSHMPLSAATASWPPFMVGQVSRPVRVTLVDDDANIRHVISNELMADLRCNLVGQATSMREGRRLISGCDFDVMLIDLSLGDGDGFELIEHLKTVRPLVEAVVISAMEDEQHALRAFALGATGYLVKNSWFGNFSQAVLQVVNGGASITPNLARRLLHRMESCDADHADHADHAEHDGAPKKGLSQRERAVLKMVAAGYTSLEIGQHLIISALTVNTHIKNIYRKLHVKTRAHAVNLALQRGLL